MCDYPSKEYFIREYITNNKSREQLAKENNVSVATIKTHLYEKHIKKPPLITKKLLVEEYCHKRKTIKQIAKELGLDRGTISRAIALHDIKRENHYVQYDSSHDEEWIELYLESGMSTTEIAELYNVQHHTVQTHLRRNGIKLRGNSESVRLSVGKDKISEDLQNYDKMYQLYLVEGLNIKEIAEIYSCDVRTVSKYLKKVGLNVSAVKEWKQGISVLNIKVRSYLSHLSDKAKIRDGFKCRICGSSNDLEVHHKYPYSKIVDDIVLSHKDLSVKDDFDKLFNLIVNDERILNIDNLTTLCRNCHRYKIHGFKKTISSQDSEKE